MYRKDHRENIAPFYGLPKTRQNWLRAYVQPYFRCILAFNLKNEEFLALNQPHCHAVQAYLPDYRNKTHL